MYKTANGKPRNARLSDGFFVIHHGKYHSRLLLELDCATEDNPRFAREVPGCGVLRSDAYNGSAFVRRWLVVTTTTAHANQTTSENRGGKDAQPFYSPPPSKSRRRAF